MRVVYADTMFLLNFAANFCLLLISAKICDVNIRHFRFMVSASAGGVYAVMSNLPSFVFLNTLLFKLVFAAFMVFVSFGFHRSFLRILSVFIAVSAALGGIVYAVSLGSDGVFTPPGISALVLSFITASILIVAVFRRTGRTLYKTHKIHISCFGKSSNFTALTDTGNSLKDPVSGEPAIIIGICDLKPVLPKDLYTLISTLSPIDALEALSGTQYAEKFRLLPYNAVGVSSGMLLALRADVKIDGEPSPKSLIAISPTDVSDGGPYSALIGNI